MAAETTTYQYGYTPKGQKEFNTGNALRGFGGTLGQANYNAGQSLADAQNAAYPMMANYVKNLSTPWGQQNIIQGNRNKLIGQAQGAATAAGALAGAQGGGIADVQAEKAAALQKAYRDANSVQSAYATPGGQAAAAGAAQQILAAMGQVPTQQNLLEIQQMINSIHQTENSAPQSGMGSIISSIISAAGTAGTGKL